MTTSDSTSGPADCRRCRHFRSAPYEARLEGCYFPDNMVSKQSAGYLDEQQQPGRHDKINRKGDCKDFVARDEAIPFWRRLFAG